MRSFNYYDQHELIFSASPSAKNQEQWAYLEGLGFHEEYFEQVMSYAPGQAAKQAAETTRSDPEGIFATATPGDKA